MKHKPVMQLHSLRIGVPIGAVLWGIAGFVVWLLLT